MVAGTYNIRFFANNGWTKLATSIPITVQPSPAVTTLRQTLGLSPVAPLTAPMNIIEKLPASARTTDNWRFIQIRPNGTVIGAAIGDERTQFCVDCHSNGALAPFFFGTSWAEASNR